MFRTWHSCSKHDMSCAEHDCRVWNIAVMMWTWQVMFWTWLSCSEHEYHWLSWSEHESCSEHEWVLFPALMIPDQNGWPTHIAMLTPSFVGFPWILQSGYQIAEELAISAKCGDKWTVEARELNTVLENNLVASGWTGGHLSTFGAIQWECELCRGKPKARCYPFGLDDHPGDAPTGKNLLM